jgi:hypothetical protein
MLTAMTSACAPSFEADLTEVEVTQRGVKMSAVPSSAPAGDVSISGAFTLSSSDAAWSKRMNSNILVHQVKIARAGSLSGLDFIRLARATVAADANPDSTTEIMKYDRGPDSASGLSIEVDMPVPVDITTAWTADRTVFGFQLAGQLPAEDWIIDVTLRLSGKITYEY